jgi:hypothetical protein
MVKGVTDADTKSKGVEAAEGSARAAATKDAPRALPDKAAKRASVTTTTAEDAKSRGVKAAEGSAKAATDTTPKKPKPKMGDYDKQLQKAATP